MTELKDENKKRPCDVLLLVKEHGGETLQFIVRNIAMDTAYRLIHEMARIKGERLADIMAQLDAEEKIRKDDG